MRATSWRAALLTTAWSVVVPFLVVGALEARSPSPEPAADVSEQVDATTLVAEITSLLRENYLDAVVAERCATRLREEAEAGAYDGAAGPEELAQAITADLQAASSDLHMRVAVAPRAGGPEQPRGDAAGQGVGTHPLLEKLDVYHFEKRGNFGVMDVRWLSGNVGYLDLRAFLDLARVRPKIESAMTLLSDTDAVVIDLRNLVRGGYPDTVAFIAGYFFSEPTLLQRIVFPRSGRADETWAAPRAGGPDLSDVPLFILTSEDVFSAGEAFTYGLQAQGRATVVGTRTRGGAHLTRSYRIEPGFDVYVPIGRSVNPATGGTWEGTGVVPDVATDADGALDAALALARPAAEKRRTARESEDRALALDVEGKLLEAVGRYGRGTEEQAAESLRRALELGFEGGVLTEDMVNDVGYYCLEQGITPAAVETFRFNVEHFPASPNAHDSLGEALVANGDVEGAEAAYRRALELNPRLSSARTALERLQAAP